MFCYARTEGQAGSLAGEQTERNSLKRFRDSNIRGMDKVQELVGLKPELRCLRAMHLGNSWNICRASYTRVARAIKAHRLRRKQNEWTRAPADKAEPSTDTNTTEATFCNMRHVTALTSSNHITHVTTTTYFDNMFLALSLGFHQLNDTLTQKQQQTPTKVCWNWIY